MCSGSDSGSYVSSRGQSGFTLQAKRWSVERRLVGRYRRPKDYEANRRSSEAWVRRSMIHFMIWRLAAG